MYLIVLIISICLLYKIMIEFNAKRLYRNKKNEISGLVTDYINSASYKNFQVHNKELEKAFISSKIINKIYSGKIKGKQKIEKINNRLNKLIFEYDGSFYYYVFYNDINPNRCTDSNKTQLCIKIR